MMLGTSIDNVVVRAFPGPGHYGRSNGGNAGGEDEAVVLSKAVGQPVRVQWSRPDDFTWSTSSPPGRPDLDASRTPIGACQASRSAPCVRWAVDLRLMRARGFARSVSGEPSLLRAKLAQTRESGEQRILGHLTLGDVGRPVTVLR